LFVFYQLGEIHLCKQQHTLIDRIQFLLRQLEELNLGKEKTQRRLYQVGDPNLQFDL
jgi:hypothetical protein